MIRGDSTEYELLRKWCQTLSFDKEPKSITTCEIGVREGLGSKIIMTGIRDNKKNIPYENRRQVIQGLWQVALADGSRDSEEDAVIRLAAKLLGVTDVESAVARKSAQGKS